MNDATDEDYQRLHDLLFDNEKDQLQELLDERYFDPGTIASSVAGYVNISNFVEKQGEFRTDVFEMVVEDSALTVERTFFNVIQELFTAIKNERETAAFADGASQFFEQVGEMFGHAPGELKQQAEGHSEKLQILVDRFARALDCLLQDLDEPYAVLEKHDLIGEWYEGNNIVEEMMQQRTEHSEALNDAMNEAMPGLQDYDRYDEQIMYVLLQTTEPTRNLKELADALIENGYELDSDEQDAYDRAYS